MKLLKQELELRSSQPWITLRDIRQSSVLRTGQAASSSDAEIWFLRIKTLSWFMSTEFLWRKCCDVLFLHSVGLLNQYCQMYSNAWLKISDFSVGSPLFYLTLSVTCVTHRLLFLFWKTDLGLDRRFSTWVERVCARVNSIFLEVSCDWVYLILAQLLSF